MDLSLKQTKAIDILEDNITNELLYGGGAGSGKSILGAYFQLKRRLKYPGTRGLMGRASLKTLKETTLMSFFEVCRMQDIRAVDHYHYNQQSGIISFNNGSIIFLKDLFLYPSDPNFDELGSLEITDAFIDECNQTVEKAWNIVKSRIRYRLDEYGLVPKLLGSCNPAKNYVYTRFYKPSKENSLPKNRKFIHALLSDNPNISRHYRDNLLGLDRASQQRLLYGNWEYDDDPATLMDFDSIVECFSNTHLRSPSDQIYKLGCDVARFGKDKTTISKWFNPCHVKFETHKGWSTTKTAERLKELSNDHAIPRKRIVIDEDGVGGGVVDQLPGCTGFINNGRPVPEPENPKIDPKTGKKLPGNYNNLKSQCGYWLSRRVLRKNLYIECDDPEVQQSIIEEMEQMKKADVEKDGPFKLVSKDKVKDILSRSPDYSDNLLMSEYEEIRPKQSLWAATI